MTTRRQFLFGTAATIAVGVLPSPILPEALPPTVVYGERPGLTALRYLLAYEKEMRQFETELLLYGHAAIGIDDNGRIANESLT